MSYHLCKVPIFAPPIMATMRKILILTNRIPYPLNDGGNLAMNAMIDGYHNAGWQVYLLAMNTSRHFIEHAKLRTLFTHLHKFEWVDINNHLRTADVLKNFFFSSQPEHAERFNKEEFKGKLKEVLKSFAPDVVQVESVYLSTYLPVVHKYSQAITVLRVHNIEYQVWSALARKHSNWFKRIYLYNLSTRIRNFERSSWTKYDLLLAITNKDAQFISRLEAVNELMVAPFGIDLKTIKQGHNEKWVGYHIGAMDWQANQHGVKWFLTKAWPRIRKAVPGFEFFFAGRAMPDSFKQMDIAGVHCMDEVASAEDFIADKKILIVPLWSAAGIRVKILEAMAAGKIVITTPVGIRGIEATSWQHYLLATKSEDFAKAIKWCFDNREAAEKMTRNARKLIEERYDSTKIMKDVLTEVEKLLGTRVSG